MTELSELYLTPNSLNMLSMIILCVTVTGYFLFIKPKTSTVWLLTLFYGATTVGFIFFLVIEMTSYYHPWFLDFVAWGSLINYLAGIALLAFTYQFPKRLPQQEREQSIVLTLAVVMVPFHIYMALQVVQHNSFVGISFQMLASISELFWVLFLLIRRGNYYKRRNQIVHAGTLRLMVTAVSLALIARITPLLFVQGFGSYNVTSATIFISYLLFIALFTFSYINHAPHPVTFRIKLVGITFITMLLILSSVGYTVTPYIEKLYTPPEMLSTKQSLHFRPNEHGSYDITSIPFQFENDMGKKLTIGKREYQSIQLDFPFPFYQQKHNNIQIFLSGYLTLIESPLKSYAGIGLKFPTIAATWIEFDAASSSGGVFYRHGSEAAVITWRQLYPSNNIESAAGSKNWYTTQVVLYPNGTFTINIRDIPYSQPFNIANKSSNLNAVGISPGNSGISAVDHISIERGLPYYGRQHQPVFQYFERDFRQFIDAALRPLALLIAGASLFILIGFPLFFNFNLAKPLKHLVNGVKRVESGDLSVKVAVTYNDEIGYVTNQFNNMVAAVNKAEKEHIRVMQLELEKNAAESANQAKSKFLANMSHELRTPLNVILGYSELISREKDISSEQRSNLETIGRSGEHLLSLINDVLELSKVEAGRTVLHQTDFDLYRLLLELEEMFELRTQQKGLSLRFIRNPDVPQFIHSDQNKLRQILINLLDNAIKFTESGSVTLRATCSEPEHTIHDQGRYQLNFDVIDSGVGIATGEQEKIFEPFSQVSELHSSHKGTGLGLPISRKFANLMGGSLNVHSEVGKTTTFTCTIMVGLAEGANRESHYPTNKVIGIKAGETVFRLLVVDDNKDNRELLSKLLQAVGFEVQEAVNGQEAIEKWKNWRPHLIWMDISMPVMDGYQATRVIKTSPGGKDTVIIALTASAFGKDKTKVVEQGGDDYVLKPFREEVIFQKISEHLGVEFIREEQDKVATATISKSEMLEALSQLTDEMRYNFLTAVNKLDFDRAMVICHQIREHNPSLADGLEELLNLYHFDILQELFEGESL